MCQGTAMGKATRKKKNFKNPSTLKVLRNTVVSIILKWHVFGQPGLLPELVSGQIEFGGKALAKR